MATEAEQYAQDIRDYFKEKGQAVSANYGNQIKSTQTNNPWAAGSPNNASFAKNNPTSPTYQPYDFSMGYYAPSANSGGGYTGTPTTLAEKAWIESYVKANNGQRPTADEAAYFKQSQPYGVRQRAQYNPVAGNTMYDLGWDSAYQKRMAGNGTQTYGAEYMPRGGKSGGIVATDSSGNPLYTTYSFNDDIKAGHYLQPTEDVMPWVSNNIHKDNVNRGMVDPALQAKYYSKPNTNIPQWTDTPIKTPDMATALKMGNQEEIREIQVEDYLESNYTTDSQILNQIVDLVKQKANRPLTRTAGELLTRDNLVDSNIQELQAKLSPLLQGQDLYETDSTGNIVTNEDGSINILDIQGVYAEAIKDPIQYKTVLSHAMGAPVGEKLQAWYNKWAADQFATQTAEQARQKQEWETTKKNPYMEQLRQRLNPSANNPPTPEFQAFIAKNNFSPEIKQHLITNYAGLFSQWQMYGEGMPFTNWIIEHYKQLGGG